MEDDDGDEVEKSKVCPGQSRRGSEFKYGLICREIQIRLHKFCTADNTRAFVLFAPFPDTPFSSTKGLLGSAYVVEMKYFL